jgi:hypothetical protein
MLPLLLKLVLSILENMISRRVIILWCFILIVACQTNDKTLFTKIDPEDSGLDFRNDIFDTEQFNIINEQYIYNGGAVAIGDFNNDGLQDIFFSGNMVPNKLYLNKGDLEFDDISIEAGIGGFDKWKSGVALVDINNDGLLDIYVCSTMAQDSSLRANLMFVNQGISEKGIPTFIDKAKEYGIEYKGHSLNAAFLDFDNDGDLDLYILTNSRQKGLPAKYMPKVNDGSSTNTDKLYRNNNDGTFTDVSKEAGILCEGYGLGLAISDINQDGLPDIYVSNDYITNDLLYMNMGAGKFKDEIDERIKHQSKFSMGNDIADINNDGYPDIITVDMLPETNLRKKTVIVGTGYITYINDINYGYTHQHVRNMLQMNNGNSTFSEIGQLAGIYQTEWSWSPLFADFDNDGYKDLFITNGFPKDITDRDFISFREKVSTVTGIDYLLTLIPSVKVANYAFKNNGDLTFSDMTKSWGLDHPSFSNGAAFADLDNDGDLDYVVNNIDDFASLYENRLYKKTDKRSSHFLRLKLLGTKENLSGLGTKVTLHYDHGKIQYHEHSIHRGYISIVEDVVHFGLGHIEKVDTIFIEWPDGKIQLLQNVNPDQVLIVDHKKAVPRNGFDIRSLAKNANQPLIKNVAFQLGALYKHTEDDKIDFNIQRTLPHKLSQSGPGIAVGDINGDGLDDFYIGGAADYAGTVFKQGKTGGFSVHSLFGEPKKEEETGVLLFDSDNDGDLDLYAVSGSYEFEPGSPYYQDKLFKNDGRGNYTFDKSALPTTLASGSCVRAADFDQDGDLDLFIGGRVPPGGYPFADESYLLQNNNGVFSNITDILCKDLIKPGMVTDALWTDFDNDEKVDLVVVGEFMSVSFYKNTGKGFEKIASGIDNYKGWFNSIVGGDYDNDGDTDYVVGNLGLNNYYNASFTQPVTVCAKDFDNNGSIDAIISCYVRAEDGTMKSYPVHFWDDLNSQSPTFRRKFTQYKEFAQVTTDKFFTPEELKGAIILEANYMATSYIENLGSGKFKILPLPILAQVAPVNGMVPCDIDDDGNLDVLLIGNDYGNEPTTGQNDAFTGLVLKGNGTGKFDAIPSVKSGFFVNGDAKGLARISGLDRDLYVATQNRDSLKVFTSSITKKRMQFRPDPLDAWAELIYTNGKKQKVEFYYGSGYLSQSTRTIFVSENVKEVIVYDSKGNKRKVIPSGI